MSKISGSGFAVVGEKRRVLLAKKYADSLVAQGYLREAEPFVYELTDSGAEELRKQLRQGFVETRSGKPGPEGHPKRRFSDWQIEEFVPDAFGD